MERSSITFVRHGETESNAADVWQGHGDSPLTARGERQVAALARRLRHRHFDVVVSSDLGRAQRTAEAAGGSITLDDAWRELDMGEWDGMARSEIFSRFADQLAELQSGKDIRWGGAETYGEFVARVDAAVDDLAATLEGGRTALVVTHGGVIHAVVAGLLGFRGLPRPWPVGRITNAALTTLEVSPRRMVAFNDGGHLNGDFEHRHGSGAVVTVVRHGETPANVRGWWHGTTDLDLTPAGEAQALAVAAALPPAQSVVASPRLRARRTADPIAAVHGVTPGTDDRLREMDFGEWEGLTTPEIRERYPDEWKAMADGRDLRRGGTGDTFAQVADRMLEGTRALAGAGERAVAVSHGGSTRALVTRILGIPHAQRTLVAMPANGSVTSLAFRDDRVELSDFNSVAHLET